VILPALFRYLFAYSTSFILSLLFATLSVVLVNRYYGLEAVGAWTLFISSIELFRSLDFGVSQLLARTTARLSLPQSRIRVLTTIFRHSFTPLFIYILIVASVFYQFYALPLSSIFQPLSLLLYFLASLIANLILNFVYNILLGLKLQSLWKSLQSIHYLCRLALLGLFPVLPTFHWLVSLFSLLDIFFVFIVLCFFLLQYKNSIYSVFSRTRSIRPLHSLSVIRSSFFRYAFFAFLMTLVSRAASQLDSLFVVNMLGVDSAALLEISTKIGLSFGMITSLVSHWLFPRASKKGFTTFNSGSLGRQIIRLLASLSFILSLVLAISYISINHILNKESVVAAFSCSVSLIAHVALCTETLIVAHSCSRGPRRIFFIDSLSLIVNLPMTLYLISEYGWVGAPIATAFSVLFVASPILSIYYNQIHVVNGPRRWVHAFYMLKLHPTLPIHLGVFLLVLINWLSIDYLLYFSICLEIFYALYSIKGLAHLRKKASFLP